MKVVAGSCCGGAAKAADVSMEGTESPEIEGAPEGSVHPDHSRQLHRINRIIGQLEGVKRMILERRYCPDILVQTKAVNAAVKSLEANILEGHLHNCVHKAFQQEDPQEVEEKVKELIQLFKDR